MRSGTVLGVGAAVATGIAAGVYGYDQVSKRMPRYRQQRELVLEVGVGLDVADLGRDRGGLIHKRDLMSCMLNWRALAVSLVVGPRPICSAPRPGNAPAV